MNGTPVSLDGHGPRAAFSVRTLADADLAAGRYEYLWDLTDDRGARVEAGMYRAVIVVGDQTLCGDIQVP